MTAEQDQRLIDALGPLSNKVCSESDVIFQGNAFSMNTDLAINKYNKQVIYTYSHIKVEDRIRGNVPDPENFTLRLPGGSYGGVRLDVKGMPEFRTGESFLLFLKKHGEDYAVVRGEYGKVSL